MVFADILAWWYSAGWLRLMHNAAARIQGVLDFFSVNLLMTTLFDPFRQIDAGRVRGSLQVELRAFGSRLFSRIIGFFIRTVTVLCGLVCAVVMTTVGLLQLLIWPLLPLAPIVGLVASMAGWTI